MSTIPGRHRMNRLALTLLLASGCSSMSPAKPGDTERLSDDDSSPPAHDH